MATQSEIPLYGSQKLSDGLTPLTHTRLWVAFCSSFSQVSAMIGCHVLIPVRCQESVPLTVRDGWNVTLRYQRARGVVPGGVPGASVPGEWYPSGSCVRYQVPACQGSGTPPGTRCQRAAVAHVPSAMCRNMNEPGRSARPGSFVRDQPTTRGCCGISIRLDCRSHLAHDGR